MPVARATVLARIRSYVVETTADFFADQRLIDLYDDGAARQHRTVLAHLDSRPDIDPREHQYTRRLISSQAITFVAGTLDYALNSDCLRVIAVKGLLSGTGAQPMDCDRVWREDDWTLTLPQFGAFTTRARYIITSQGKLRVLPAGSYTTVNYRVDYIRDLVRTGANTNVDLEDPYNEGPILRAVAFAKAEQGIDPSPWIVLSDRETVAILAPPPPEVQG